MSPARPAAVVLDLGNVVIDWQPLPAIAAGVGEEEARRFLADFDFSGWNHGPDSGQSWDDALDDVRRTAPQWLPHARAYRECFAASLLGEVPGTAAVVRDLVDAGVPVWGLSNWSEELYYAHAPQRFEVLGLFAEVLVSGEVGVAKPDPAIYALAAERSGLPIGSLFFADDKELNVRAAQEAGMDAVLFTDAQTLRADLRERGLAV